MHTDDLGRNRRRQMHRLIDADRATIARYQLIALAYDVDNVAVQEDPTRFAQRHAYSSEW